jgi:hypothetical protein
VPGEVVEEEEEAEPDLEDLQAHFTRLRVSGKAVIKPEWEARVSCYEYLLQIN